MAGKYDNCFLAYNGRQEFPLGSIIQRFSSANVPDSNFYFMHWIMPNDYSADEFQVGHPPHTHEEPEILFHIGIDPTNPTDLGAEIEFTIGEEMETRYRLFSWWELFGMVGYTHARFLSNSSAFNANLGVNQGVGGNMLPYTPTFNANMGTQVSWAPSRYAKFYVRVQLSKYGDSQYDASNAAGQRSYHLVNFRGGVRTKHWFAEGWADNAFNAHYVPVAIPYAQLGAPSGYIGESGTPVTYGTRLGLTF